MFFFFFMSMIGGAIAGAMVPVDESSTAEVWARNQEIAGAISRISPCTLYGEATAGLLTPELGSMNPAIMAISILTGRMLTPLALSQSLLLVWPQVVGIIALAALCFAASYIKFMREEIRSI